MFTVNFPFVKGEESERGGKDKAAGDHGNISSMTGFGMSIEPCLDRGEVGDARQDFGLAVAIDHHGARQLARPGGVDLVA